VKAWVKVCGVTTPADAELAVEAGASAIGINLWPKSPRSVSLERAESIAQAVRGRVEIVAVTVDFAPEALARVRERLRPDRLQLHGSEEDALVASLGPSAYKAVGLGAETDVARALRAPGSLVLIDAKDEVRRGGTGRAPPASLASRVCAVRPTVLAGGLGPDNVAAAIEAFAPAGVDAASGIESAAGKKDAAALRGYVQAARAAFSHVRDPSR
jgi:phosphoribosylanthranilate isomerase